MLLSLQKHAVKWIKIKPAVIQFVRRIMRTCNRTPCEATAESHVRTEIQT